MQTTILHSISSSYSTLTRSAKKLADYIFNNRSSVQYMSITSLAEAAGVSEATITRFCRTLGLAGYNELKLELALAQAGRDEGEAQEEERQEADSDSGSELEAACRNLYQQDVNALSETLELMDPERTRQAVELLTKAKRVLCFGQGGSNVTAMEAWARFSTAASKFIHIDDSHMQATAAALCQAGDVILFVSYSGSTRDMLDVLRPAKNGGASVILITRFYNSPAASLSDVVLLCGATESPLQSGSIAAKIGQMFIIDYLFHGYWMENQEACAAAQEITAQATARKLL